MWNDDDVVLPDPEVCTIRSGSCLSITVRDASDNSLLTGVMITALDQGFTEILDEVTTGVYEGSDERVGNYQLIIEKDGFQTIVTPSMMVGMDEDLCHVETLVLTYELEPM